MIYLFLFALLIIFMIGACFWLKLKSKMIAVITVFVIIGSISLIIYRLTPAFKDIILSMEYDQQHRCTFNNNDTVYFPLPPRTSFEYRTSDVTAFYRSELSINEIKEYYSLFDNYVVVEHENIIKVKYSEVIFEISIQEVDRICRLTIKGVDL